MKTSEPNFWYTLQVVEHHGFPPGIDDAQLLRQAKADGILKRDSIASMLYPENEQEVDPESDPDDPDY